MFADRHLPWPRCLNLRDLGGLPTPSAPTPWRVFIRGDDLSQLNPAGLSALHAYGVATVLDLRRPTEVSQLPPQAALISLRYHHIPLLDDEPNAFSSLDAVYLFIARERAARLAEICFLIASAPTPLVFHCLHGKDRTGIIAALLLSLAGVPEKDILSDYVLSDTHLAPLYAKLVEQTPQDQLARVLDDSSCPPRRLQSVLDYWREVGGSESYLMHAGLDAPTLAALRTRLQSTS